eukprot:364108-Chlamydomonas_euryale.AAC.1
MLGQHCGASLRMGCRRVQSIWLSCSAKCPVTVSRDMHGQWAPDAESFQRREGEQARAHSPQRRRERSRTLVPAKEGTPAHTRPAKGSQPQGLCGTFRAAASACL